MALTLLKKKPDEQTPAPTDSGPATDESGHAGYEWPSPAKPSAMLVPTYVRENRALASTKRGVFFAMIALVAIVVLAAAAAFLANLSSKGALEDALADRDAAQTQVDALDPVADYYDGLEKRSQATVELLSGDLRHADLFRHVNAAMTGNASMTGYTTTLGVPCLGPDPFSPDEALGCIAITGEAPSRNAVARVLTGLEKGKGADLVAGGFVKSVDSSGEHGEKVTFTLNVNFTSKALSNKYVPRDAASADQSGQAATDPTQDGAQ